MMRDITFGQYLPTGSIVHNLDPRMKLVLTVLLIVSLFVCSNLISMALFAICIIIIMLATKINPLMYLRSIKMLIPIIIFTSLLNVFYITSGEVLVSFWSLSITTGGIQRAVFMSFRIILLIFCSSILTFTTTPNDITDALERLFKPLTLIGLGRPVHVIAMMMTIAMRFIPLLIEETDKIMSAQKARGADMENGNLIKRIRALMPVLIPLFISAVRHAFELSDAMECRCYSGGEGRQRMKQMNISPLDYFAAAFCVLTLIGIIILNVFF